MSQTATRRLQFASGHRVFGHESKCANVHGHNYVVMIKAEAEVSLDSIGRVIDFGVLKVLFGNWIEHYWDHGMLLNKKDPLAMLWQSQELLINHKLFVCDFNPTAEEMARHLLSLSPLLLEGTNVRVTSIKLWETENCVAEATL